MLWEHKGEGEEIGEGLGATILNQVVKERLTQKNVFDQQTQSHGYSCRKCVLDKREASTMLCLKRS